MYWYKKTSTDTGNPELVEKDNEGSDKQANDKPKEEVNPEEAKNDDVPMLDDTPAGPESKPLEIEVFKPSKIIEPVEEYKMKKELSDLQFTYVICATCYKDKKYPHVLNPENFEK
jgi:hypothetical protein